VIRAIQTLERYELIHIEERRLKVRGQTTNVFTLCQVDKTGVSQIYPGPPTGVSEVYPDTDRGITDLLPGLTTDTGGVSQLYPHINNTHVNKTQLTKNGDVARARAEPTPPTALELIEADDDGETYFDPVEALIEIDFTPAQAVEAQSAYREAELTLDRAEVARIAHYIAAPPAHIQRPCGYLASQWRLGKVPPLVTPPIKRGPVWDKDTQRFEPQPATLPPEVLQERDRLLAEIESTRGQLDPRVVDARAAIARVKVRAMPPASVPASDYWRSS
jgi:hypothetical protein